MSVKFEVGKKYCSSYCVAPYTCLATFVHNDMHKAVMESPVTQYPILVITSEEWTEYREPIEIVRYCNVYKHSTGKLTLGKPYDTPQEAHRFTAPLSGESCIGVIKVSGTI